METFKVTDPKGIHLDGKLRKKGETVQINEGPQLDAFLHFRQLRPFDPEAEADAKAKESADAKAKADADAKAKAKAEADAKAKDNPNK